MSKRSQIKLLSLLLTVIYIHLPKDLSSQISLRILSKTLASNDSTSQVKNFGGELELQQYLREEKLKAFKEGYLAFSFDGFAQKDSSNYQVFRRQGKKYQWGQMKWLVSPLIGEIAGLDPKQLKGKTLSPQSMDNYLEKVIRYYERNGYPFATVQLQNVNISGQQLSADVQVTPGKKVIFADSIVVHGDLKINNNYLQQFTGIVKGNSYDEGLISQLDKRLIELPFAQRTKESALEIFGDRALVHVYLDKRSANFFNGVVGILPNSPQLVDVEGSNLLVTGDVQLLLINGLKQGERIDINWNRLKPETQRLKLGTNVPYLFSSPFGIDEQLDFLKQDSSFLNFNNQLGLSYSLSPNQRLTAYWEAAFTNVLEASDSHEESAVGNSSNNYGLRFQWQDLDYRYNPRKGFEIFVDVKAGLKKLEGTSITEDSISVTLPAFSGTGSYNQVFPQRINQLDIEAYLAFYQPVFKISTIKFGLKNAYIHNPYLFLNDLYRIGGFKKLRGFDEQSMFASWYHIATIEYRLLLEQNSYISFFYDQAFTQKNTVQEQKDDTPYGFGASVSFQTRAGVFSLIYALGSEQGNAINFQTGKIHFGFTSLF